MPTQRSQLDRCEAENLARAVPGELSGLIIKREDCWDLFQSHSEGQASDSPPTHINSEVSAKVCLESSLGLPFGTIQNLDLLDQLF